MRRVKDAGREPFNAIGLIMMRWDDGKTYFGSGALITPSHVLTCAHNFINQDNQPPGQAVSAEFLAGWNSNPLPRNGGVAATCALVPAPYPRINDEWDIAILRLGAKVLVPFPFALTVTDTKAFKGATVRLTGYPQDDSATDGLMFDDDDTVDVVDIRTNSVLVTHATLGGSSGSPLWSQGEAAYHVYAVHNSVHDLNVRRGTLITPKVHAFLMASLKQACAGPFVQLVGGAEDEG